MDKKEILERLESLNNQMTSMQREVLALTVLIHDEMRKEDKPQETEAAPQPARGQTSSMQHIDEAGTIAPPTSNGDQPHVEKLEQSGISGAHVAQETGNTAPAQAVSEEVSRYERAVTGDVNEQEALIGSPEQATTPMAEPTISLVVPEQAQEVAPTNVSTQDTPGTLQPMNTSPALATAPVSHEIPAQPAQPAQPPSVTDTLERVDAMRDLVGLNSVFIRYLSPEVLLNAKGFLRPTPNSLQQYQEDIRIPGVDKLLRWPTGFYRARENKHVQLYINGVRDFGLDFLLYIDTSPEEVIHPCVVLSPKSPGATKQGINELSTSQIQRLSREVESVLARLYQGSTQ